MNWFVLLLVLGVACRSASDDALEGHFPQDDSSLSKPPTAKKTPTEVAELLTFAGMERESRGIEMTKRAFAKLARLYQDREQLAGKELTDDQLQRVREVLAQRHRESHREMATAERLLVGTSEQRYVELWNWLARRAQDELEHFEPSYTRFIAEGFEVEFCEYAYRRWPPEPGLLGPELR